MAHLVEQALVRGAAGHHRRNDVSRVASPLSGAISRSVRKLHLYSMGAVP
jgi:hypothetical protein